MSGSTSAYGGHPRWEEKHPRAAAVLLRELVEAHAQQDPTFPTSLAFTRLTAKAALEALRAQGIAKNHLTLPSPLVQELNRMGYRLREVVKARPQKKIKQIDVIIAF